MGNKQSSMDEVLRYNVTSLSKTGVHQAATPRLAAGIASLQRLCAHVLGSGRCCTEDVGTTARRRLIDRQVLKFPGTSQERKVSEKSLILSCASHP